MDARRVVAGGTFGVSEPARTQSAARADIIPVFHRKAGLNKIHLLIEYLKVKARKRSLVRNSAELPED